MSNSDPGVSDSEAGSHVSLEVDLDGTYLVNPIEDWGSLETVYSQHHSHRVTPEPGYDYTDIPDCDQCAMAPKDKQLKAFKTNRLLWVDQYKDLRPESVLSFQLEPTLNELVSVLAELRDVEVFFDDNPSQEFTDEMLEELRELRGKFSNIKTAIQNHGASVTAPPAGATPNPTAAAVAKASYAAMVPSLRSSSTALKASLTELRSKVPMTTAEFKKADAEFSVLDEDLGLCIKQWQGLKLEAVTASDQIAATHCINWIRDLEEQRRLTVNSHRVSTARLGFLPGQGGLTSAAVNNVTPPKFNGKISEKMDFFTFEELLDDYFDSTGSYSHALKLLKLRSDCLSGGALQAVKDCDTYEKAMEELRKLFGQPRILFTAKVTEIKKIGKCPDTPLEARAWAIEVGTLLRNLSNLATNHKIETMFDGSNIVEIVESSFRTRDLYKFRDRLRDLRVTEQDFNLESRAKRVGYILEFLNVIVEDATFDVDFQMTRSYKACENVIQGKVKQTGSQHSKDEKHTRKTYFASNIEYGASDSSSCDEEEETCPPPPKQKPKKKSSNPVYTNKSATPKDMMCKLCKKDHSHVAYCPKYQKSLIKRRWKLLCVTKACPRCMRMDASFRYDDREQWYEEHKNYCTDLFLCDVDHCADREPHLANNITLCAQHREQNEEKMLEYVKSLDKKKIPNDLRFFFNHDTIFNNYEPPPSLPVKPPTLEDDTAVVVEKDTNDPAIYMLQTIPAPHGGDLLVFYDTGCYGAAISERAYSLLDTATVRPGPTQLEVAGGRIVTVEHGDEQFLLEVDTTSAPRRFAAITALRLQQVSTKFPLWPLTQAWKKLNDAYVSGNQGIQLPTTEDAIGGREVDVMIGMRFHKYYPKQLFFLPCGLCIFKATLKSTNGHQGVLGGTSALWRDAMNAAHHLGPAVFFAAEMRAYQSHCHTVWDLTFAAQKPSCADEITYPHVNYAAAATNDEENGEECEMTRHMAMAVSTSKIRDMLMAEEYGTSLDYRCPGCRNCYRCKNSEVLDKISLQEENEQFLIEQSIEYHPVEKKVVAKLPFIMDPEANLATNYYTAKKILQSQIRIAAKRNDGAERIIISHNKLRDKGYVCRLDELPPDLLAAANQDGYYIPWRTVESGSLSTPVRMVFDASSKTSSGYSLNDILAKGVNMLANMVMLLAKFRMGAHAFTADVSMAYNCVALHPDFLRYHKYLWVEDLNPNGDVIEMVIRSLIYGVRSSGNQTIVAFHVTAREAAKKPQLADTGGPECLEDSSYLDDIFDSFWNAVKCHVAAGGLEDTLALSTMGVKEVTFNGQSPSERVSADGVTVSLVGYLWEPVADVLRLDIKPLYFGKKKRGRMPAAVTGDVREALLPKFTRREICGKVAGVYDPLGLAAPITAKLKLDLREVVKLQGDWDELIDPKLADKWVNNLEEIQQLADFKIPRSPVLGTDCKPEEWELIVATDASEVIAAAACYVTTMVNGRKVCLLAAAKTKLVSKMTVPRAELRACALGACLAATLKRVYGGVLTRTTYVSDSMVALSWINTDDRPLQVGVRNAVIQIRRFSEPSEWFHVPTSANPADLATRGLVNVDEISEGSVWQQGYEWMRENDAERPLTPSAEILLSNEEKVAAAAETRSRDVSGIVLSNLVRDVADRYSYSKYLIDPCERSWPKFVRKLAIIIKLCKIWRRSADKIPTVCGKVIFNLEQTDLAAATNIIFKIATTEVKQFCDKKDLKDCVEEDDILKYTGRFVDGLKVENKSPLFLDVSPLSFNVPLVDRYSPVAYSIMMHAHMTMTQHGGVQSTLRASRTVAFIIKGRDLAKEVKKECGFCKRYKAKTLDAEMGKIHPSQTTVAPAFYNVQVDLFGPVDATSKHFKRRTIKAYGAIFKCPATLAVSVFVMDQYDTASFLDAFFRFACMYGLPHSVFIDSGTQLLAAFRHAEFSVTDITKTLNGKFGVKLEFETCPVGAHQAHGMVERAVREVKKLFSTVFKGLKLDLLQLETAFFYVCNELNSLPMCLGSKTSDLDQLDLITPARLLHGRNNQRAVAGMPQAPRPTVIARQIKEIETTWWKIWETQRVADLMPKSPKWRDGNPDVSVGDVVVFIRDQQQLGGLTWRLGEVISVEVGRDDVTRRVEIRYKHGDEKVYRTTRRSVRQVAVLCHEDDLDLPGLLSAAQRAANISFCQENTFK